MGRGRPKRRPPNPSESSEDEAFMMPIGAAVEVRRDDPGFAGSFYEATVASHLLSDGGHGRYTVSYSTLLGEEAEPLRETAAAANVRPRPPPEEREVVIHEAGGGYLKCAYVWRTFMVTDIKVWRKADFLFQRLLKKGKGSPLFSEGNQVEVSHFARKFSGSWNPATVLKVIGATHFLVQYMHIGKDDESATEILDSQYIRPSRDITNMDSRYRFSPASHVEVLHEGGWRPAIIVKVLGSEINKKYVVNLKNPKTDMDDVEPVDVLTVESTQLRPRFDWDGKKWVRCLKKPSLQTYVHEMHPFQKPCNGPRLTSRKRPIPAFYDDSDKLKDEDVTSEQISPVLSIRKENNEIIHKQGNAAVALRSGLSLTSLPQMAAFGSLSSSTLAPGCHLEQSSSQMIIVPSMAQNRQIQASLFEGFGEPRPVPQGPLLGTRSLGSDFRIIEGSKNVLSGQDKQSTVGTGTELSRQMEKGVSSQTTVVLGENPETIQPMKGITAPAKATEEDKLPNDVTAGCETLPEMDELSCIDPTSRKDTGGSEAGNGRNDLEQEGYTCEAHDSCCPLLSESAAVHESIMDTNGRVSEALACQHLPFVKTSPMWAHLEGLEIFRKAPQRPNFHQFEQHGQEICEGLALGLMLSFAILAESINRLNALDDSRLLEQKMAGLALLEADGFDVKDLRSRVETLLHAKNSCVEPQDSMRKLEEKIAHKETKDQELGTQVRSLAMAVHHHDLHAYLMRNVMRSAITQKMNNAMEISRLKTEANKLKRSCLSKSPSPCHDSPQCYPGVRRTGLLPPRQAEDGAGAHRSEDGAGARQRRGHKVGAGRLGAARDGAPVPRPGRDHRAPPWARRRGVIVLEDSDDDAPPPDNPVRQGDPGQGSSNVKKEKDDDDGGDEGD
ncbi:hypothetical protein TRIUR3_27701 [Triticum urartu]|uniref:Agenet domain-containing protein n=1 Tax=Triticum urartu TaxID=4572 RepID=M7YCS8_TRIUA|nr:hypothetical protein TRIUR3_27701 [Triticum urartu]